MPTPTPKRKKVTDAQVDGDRGEHLTGDVVGEIGFLWHPSGKVEAGIDGTIELRDTESEEVRAGLIAVQCRATKNSLRREDDRGFDWELNDVELNYWMAKDIPVVLIVWQLTCRRAYWVSIKNYFADAQLRAKRTVRFDKQTDRFTGDSGPALEALIRADREQRRQRTRMMLLEGPYEYYGLTPLLERAREASARGDHADAAKHWIELATELEERQIDKQVVWPLLERAASSLREAGDRDAAIAYRLRLARERLDLDDPHASYELHQAFWLGVGDNFGFALMSLEAEAAEQGMDILDGFREFYKQSSDELQRRHSGSALVDQLMLFGLYGEAFKIANRIVRKRLDDPTKRAIALDRLDAAGELGQDVEPDWNTLLEKAVRLGPAVYGQVLQRRALFLCRRGLTTDSQETFLDAAKSWSEVDGADEQVAEALFSAELANAINGDLGFERDLGTRQVAALARGSGNVPTVRAERLLLNGLGDLANKNTPEAIKHLTMAARVERRAGDLFGLRRTLAMLGRAYDAANEPEQALRWWIQAGIENQASASAQLIDTNDALLAMLRLDSQAPWERATSLAALVAVADRLTNEEVAMLAKRIIAEAHDPPSIVAPQPSYYARQLIVAVADKLPQDQFAAAVTILEEELELGGYSAQRAPEALLMLKKRGADNGLQPIAEAILAGQDVTVTIAEWLRSAPKKMQLRFVERARSGDIQVLAEICRADLSERFPELIELCEAQVAQAIQTHKTSATEYINFSFTDLGEFGRFCSRATQSRLADLLGDVLISTRYDNLSKTTAMIATALLAPALDQSTASSLLTRVLPAASGDIPDSAPAVMRSHHNPERSRNRLNRDVPAWKLRAATIQAAARLAQIAAPASADVRDMIDAALTSSEPELQRTALNELSQLPGIGPRTPLQPLLDGNDPAVAAAAQSLLAARPQAER